MCVCVCYIILKESDNVTITEYSKKIKNDYEEHIVLIKYGKFYRTFDYDAFIINYLYWK